MSNKISKKVWAEISEILKKYEIPYTAHYESRDIPKAMEFFDVTVHDKHIHINLVIPDYYEENK